MYRYIYICIYIYIYPRKPIHSYIVVLLITYRNARRSRKQFDDVVWHVTRVGNALETRALRNDKMSDNTREEKTGQWLWGNEQDITDRYPVRCFRLWTPFTHVLEHVFLGSPRSHRWVHRWSRFFFLSFSFFLVLSDSSFPFPSSGTILFLRGVFSKIFRMYVI